MIKTLKPRYVLICLSALAGPVMAQAQDVLSEKDFLGEVPVVLSVSRLPQRLDETPGAVTILDRETIRASGVRDVADLLRLVPGYRVSTSFESNSPQGSYHTSLSDYSNHMQVMVDGRSVYSVYMHGSTGPGLQAVAIEDIERIEVYRGSNSAAYGARAFLGTINIITRDPLDTQSGLVRATGGDNGILDGMVRVGGGDDTARFRLSADSRADNGLRGTSGPDRVHRLNVRGDVRASSRDTVELRAGQSVLEAGVGFSNEDGNAPRRRQIGTSFVQLDWKRNVGVDQDLLLQASHTSEAIRDHFPYRPQPSLLIDFGGRASNSSLLLQHTLRAGTGLRLVWGGELRREAIVSRPLYDTDSAFTTDFVRIFTNAEWRLHRDWLLNVGAMHERSNISGEHTAPRAMLNWHFAPGQTLRYGMTEAFRPPSTFEKFASVRYYLNGVLQDSTDVANGNVSPERIQTRELGYLIDLPNRDLSLDVRVFEEKVRGFIKRVQYNLPGSGALDTKVWDYVNGEDFDIYGFEYQLRLKPWAGGQLLFSQAWVDNKQLVGSGAIRPYGSLGMMWMQHLGRGFDLSVLYSQADASHFPGKDQDAPAMSRTDIRIAKSMRIGRAPAEVALVVQNLGEPYQDFMPGFRFHQQAYVMLTVGN